MTGQSKPPSGPFDPATFSAPAPAETVTPSKSPLTTLEKARLDDACRRVRKAFDNHGPYLVGTAAAGRRGFRDVDVRTILPDEEFDALFGGRERLWDLLCMSVSQYLTDVTGLPVDYQVQRMTEANHLYVGPRHALGINAPPADRFAGGGDATPATCRDCGTYANPTGHECPPAADDGSHAHG